MTSLRFDVDPFRRSLWLALGLRAHGVVDAPLRAAVWDRGLRELVRPSALALGTAA